MSEHTPPTNERLIELRKYAESGLSPGPTLYIEALDEIVRLRELCGRVADDMREFRDPQASYDKREKQERETLALIRELRAASEGR